MKDLNAVHLIGRLGRDPEVHSTDTGIARTTFSVATNRTWTNAEGQVQTETEWTRCATWGTLAEIAAQFLHKGSRVYVAGRLHTSRWADAQTGEQRSRVENVVDDLILLDRSTPAVMLEDEPDAGDSQPTPNTPVPTPHTAAHQPIRRPLQPVELHTTSGTRPQPSTRRSHER